MAQHLFKSDTASEVLAQVREGMPVFDRNNDKIGRVKYVQFGDESESDPIAKPAEFYRLPPETQTRLARQGFVQIDCGIFAKDRAATPDQIAELSDHGLRLNVMGDRLVTM